MKVEVFPVNSNVRGNTTTNVSEGMNAANASARNVPMHVGVGEFNDLQRARFFANTHAAHDCATWLPPKVAKIHDEMVESAQGLTGEVGIPDAAHPQREARVLGYSGKRYYTSNLEGDRADADVKCSCAVPRVQGHPCAHNMKHALQIGRLEAVPLHGEAVPLQGYDCVLARTVPAGRGVACYRHGVCAREWTCRSLGAVPSPSRTQGRPSQGHQEGAWARRRPARLQEEEGDLHAQVRQVRRCRPHARQMPESCGFLIARGIILCCDRSWIVLRSLTFSHTQQ